MRRESKGRLDTLKDALELFSDSTKEIKKKEDSARWSSKRIWVALSGFRTEY